MKLFLSSLLKIYKRKKKGFTLIEIALAIMVLSVIFIVLFGVNFTVSRISKNNSEIVREKTQVIHVLNIIQNSIRLAYYFPEQEKTVFFGKSNGIENARIDQLTFTGIIAGSEYSGGGVVGEISYYLKKDSISDTGKLYRREELIVDESPYSGGNHYVLLENVVSFQVQYSLNGVEWQDNWSSRSTRRIPRMIRFKLIVKIGKQEEIFETLAVPGVYLK